MKLGIITDTHGQIHPKVFELFDDVDIILHAGDIDTEDILTQLETLAPVKAVRGNVDPYVLVKRLPEKQILTFEGKNILLIHQALDGQDVHENVKEVLAKQKIDIVVFGHTHVPLQKEIDETLFFNPGGAGRKRFSLPLGVGIIEIKNGKIEATIKKLD
jgi:uncharacterized protein